MNECNDDWISLQETFKFVFHSGIRLVFTPNSLTSRFPFYLFSNSIQSAKKMPVYKVHKPVSCANFVLFPESSQQRSSYSETIFGDRQWLFWKLCDSRNFIPYATYLVGIPLKQQSDEWIVVGCKFRRSLYHV